MFSLHEHAASSVQVLGSWNDWRAPGIVAVSVEPGYWRTLPVHLSAGRYTYKFLLDGQRWLDDPNNPRKAPDGLGSLNSVVVVPGDIHPEASEDSGVSSMIATHIET